MLSAQAKTTLVAYGILMASFLIPLKGDRNLSKKLALVVVMLIPISLAVYTINCLVTGSKGRFGLGCNVLAWMNSISILVTGVLVLLLNMSGENVLEEGFKQHPNYSDKLRGIYRFTNSIFKGLKFTIPPEKEYDIDDPIVHLKLTEEEIFKYTSDDQLEDIIKDNLIKEKPIKFKVRKDEDGRSIILESSSEHLKNIGLDKFIKSNRENHIFDSSYIYSVGTGTNRTRVRLRLDLSLIDEKFKKKYEYSQDSSIKVVNLYQKLSDSYIPNKSGPKLFFDYIKTLVPKQFNTSKDKIEESDRFNPLILTETVSFNKDNKIEIQKIPIERGAIPVINSDDLIGTYRYQDKYFDLVEIDKDFEIVDTDKKVLKIIKAKDDDVPNTFIFTVNIDDEENRRIVSLQPVLSERPTIMSTENLDELGALPSAEKISDEPGKRPGLASEPPGPSLPPQETGGIGGSRPGSGSGSGPPPGPSPPLTTTTSGPPLENGGIVLGEIQDPHPLYDHTPPQQENGGIGGSRPGSGSGSGPPPGPLTPTTSGPPLENGGIGGSRPGSGSEATLLKLGDVNKEDLLGSYTFTYDNNNVEWSIVLREIGDFNLSEKNNKLELELTEDGIANNNENEWASMFIFYVEKHEGEFILKHIGTYEDPTNPIYHSSQKRIPLSSPESPYLQEESNISQPEDQINGHINTIENIQLSGSGTITNSLTYSAAPIDNNYMEYCLNNEELGKHCIRVGPGIIEFPKAGRDGLKLQLTDGTKGSGTDSDLTYQFNTDSITNTYTKKENPFTMTFVQDERPYRESAELKFPNFGFQLTPLQKR